MYSFRLLGNALIVSSLFYVSFFSSAASQIHFTEYKILLTEKDSSSEYRIFNQGDSAALCSTSFIDYMIAPDGKLTPPEEGQLPTNSAKAMLRASPSRVVIDANGAQKLKVIARGVSKKSDGEWHSYLNLRCKDADVNLQNGINIIPNFVFNIPVTIRKGQLTASVEISQAKLISHAESVWVELMLNRRGTRSLYGDFNIFEESGELLGQLKGVALYVQSSSVPFKIMLSKRPIGKLNITFKEDSRFGGEQSATIMIN